MYQVSRPRRIRALGALALAAAGAVVLSACSSSSASTPTATGGHTTVNAIIHTVSGAAWPTFVAQEEGYFSDKGLDVKLTTVSPAVSANALVSGSADIGMVDSYSLVSAIDKGANVTIVGQAVDNQPYYLLAAKGITKVSQLKGKTIGVSSALDPYGVVLNGILKANGVDPSSVDFVYGQGSSDRLAALEGGAIQATLLPPPTSDKATAEGFNTLAKTRDTVPVMTTSSIGANTAWAKANPNAAKAYIAALGKAAKWLNDPANKTKAIAILQKNVQGTSDADADSAYTDYVTAHVWNDTDCVQPKAVSALLKRLVSLKAAKSSDPKKYSTTKYCS